MPHDYIQVPGSGEAQEGRRLGPQGIEPQLPLARSLPDPVPAGAGCHQVGTADLRVPGLGTGNRAGAGGLPLLLARSPSICSSHWRDPVLPEV